MSLHALRNPVREYAWGSHRVLADLLGEPVPSPRPQAELWMGAHPRASSEIQIEGSWRPLRKVILDDPTRWLGEEILARHGGELPFLLKVLAVGQPLSLQAHPDAAHARDGFDRENAAGVARDAAERCYPDARGKPELVCALTPFRALCGFRSPARQRQLCADLGVAELDRVLALAPREPATSLLAALLRLPASEGPSLARAVATAATARAGREPAFTDLATLATHHPEDPVMLAALLLEAVVLRPGEALYLPPGELHAYLAGTGVELMASSDNVVRAGLTGKRVDVEELLTVANPAPRPPRPLRAEPVAPGERGYLTPCEDFQLSVLRVAPDAALERKPGGRPEILFCHRGEARIDAPDTAAQTLSRGGSLIVAARTPSWRLRGDAEIYRATVPSAAT